MSPFLQSGRSDAPKSGKTNVRFRPEADIMGLTQLPTLSMQYQMYTAPASSLLPTHI